MPYLVMAGTALLMLLAVWRLWPSPVRVWAFVLTGGSISIGDLFVNGIFNLYEYHPGLLSGRADDYLGVLTAECLFVPSYYALLSAVPLRLRAWVFGLSPLLLLALEHLFTYLHVYDHHGWRYTYTLVLFGAFSLPAVWAIRVFEMKGYARWRRAVVVGGSVYLVMNLWGLILFGILRVGSIHLGLVRNADLDLVLSSLLLHASLFTLIGLAGIWTGWILRLQWAALAAALLAGWFFFLKSRGIWEGRWPWNPVLDAVLVIGTHQSLALLDRWMARTAPPQPPQSYSAQQPD